MGGGWRTDQFAFNVGTKSTLSLSWIWLIFFPSMRPMVVKKVDSATGANTNWSSPTRVTVAATWFLIGSFWSTLNHSTGGREEKGRLGSVEAQVGAWVQEGTYERRRVRSWRWEEREG